MVVVFSPISVADKKNHFWLYIRSSFNNKVNRTTSMVSFWCLDISFFYINCIINCKIKRDNHQVPKIARVPGNKKLILRNKTNKKINK